MNKSDALKRLGLNEKEISIYLTLLKKGPASPAAIAKLTRINRATAYSVAKSLRSKGLLSEDLGAKTLRLVATPPERLGTLLEQEKRELQSKEILIREAIQELSLITADREYPVPKLQFIQEADLEKFLYDNLGKWQKSVMATEKIWWGFQDHTFVEKYEDWIHATWKTPEGKDPSFKGRVITNHSPIESTLGKKYNKEKRAIRFLSETNFTSTVWVAGEYVVMIMTRHHPHYLFEIHDATLAQNMGEMLRKLWESAE